MSLLISNIKKLYQAEINPPDLRKGSEMKFLPVLENAWLYCINDRITSFGIMSELPGEYLKAKKVIDASDRIVIPGFCDSHTHLVYAGSREMEYIDKINGLSYEEINRKGGGILNSAKLLHETSESELFNQSAERVKEIMFLGTVAVEIKSGYGLNVQDEIKMLRVIQRLKKEYPITVKSTFLGAHAIPSEFKNNRKGYIDLIINEMIPAIADENLADFIDVFCEDGFFTPDETSDIVKAGLKSGMRPKIHANELGESGGILTGVNNNALSVDHLEYIDETEIQALLNSNTMPTILPSASFFMGLKYAPVRKLLNAGLPLALATDYNPGTSPSGNMKFILSLASIKLGLHPFESINAATLNGAFAMGVEVDHGTISPGKFASFIITKKMPGIEYFSYAFGSDLIENVFIKGLQIR